MTEYRPGKYVDKAEIQIFLEIILKSEKDKKARKYPEKYYSSEEKSIKMNKSCARCSKVVYPIEELKCLDKVITQFAG